MIAPGRYEDIVGEAARFIRRHIERTCAQELLGKDLLLRNGRATFDCPEEKKTHDLFSPSDWDIIRADVVRHCGPRALPKNRDVNDIDICRYFVVKLC